MRVLDFHCHVYPDNIAKKAAKAVADFYNVVPGVDIPDLNASLKNVLAAQESAGIDLTVVCSAATTPHQVRHINAFLSRCIEESRGRCLAFGTLHPNSDDLDGDVAHLLSLGIRGIKFHPEMQKCALDSPAMMKLVDAADGRLPFLLHTGDSRFSYSNPEQLVPLLTTFPQTRFIGAHMGGYTVWQKALEKLARKYDNLWVDISSTTPWVGPEALCDMIHAYGTERVLFGTDFPMWCPKEEVERFMALPLTHEELRKIAWDNAAGLLGL